MYHSLLMFFAPENSTTQASPVPPPAQATAVRALPRQRKSSIRFMAGVAANAIGFGTLLAGCWFSLQLMQALLVA